MMKEPLFINIDLAGVVLDKCVTTEERDINGTPSTTQIVYNYEFIEDFNEPQLGTLGKFLLERVLHYTSKSHIDDIPLVMINNQVEGSGHHSFSSTTSIKPTTNPMTNSSVKDWGPKVYDKDNHTMALMVMVIVKFVVMC